MKKYRYVFVFLYRFLSPSLKKTLVAIFLFGLVEIFLTIRIPFVNADLINALAYSQWDIFKHWAIILLLLFAGQLIVGLCNKYLLVLFNENMEKNLRDGVFEYLLTQPAVFTEKYSTGDILSRILNDTPKMKNFIIGVALQFCFDVIAITVTFFILFQHNWVLSFIVFAFAPLAIFTGSFFKIKIGGTTREVQEKVAIFTSKAQSWIVRFVAVKIYGIERISFRQFEKDSQQYTHSTIKAGKWNILMNTVNAVFLGAPSILILVVGGYYCLQGKLSIGELFAFLTFSTYFIAPLQRMIALINVELPRIYPIYERFKEFGIADYNHSIVTQTLSTKKNCMLKINTLEINNLEYINEKSDFGLSIPKLIFHTGHIYGIQGTNGTGKTTFAKLLKGILSPQTGTVYFSNTQQVRPESQIFLLSQNAFLFDGSLLDNIKLFSDDCDMEKYHTIIRLLNIEKYESILSPSDNNIDKSRMLSGGELQKINIARMMYSQFPVLIMDEPDSFVDTNTKTILMDWIRQNKKNKIMIIITHDCELLEICDTTYHLESITEKPNHSMIRL